jgi:hypothetical protein
VCPATGRDKHARDENAGCVPTTTNRRRRSQAHRRPAAALRELEANPLAAPSPLSFPLMTEPNPDSIAYVSCKLPDDMLVFTG